MLIQPDWQKFEDRIYAEALRAINILKETFSEDELAIFVLWADPYKGWYEFIVDTRKRNEEGTITREQKMRRLRKELGDNPEAWKRAQTYARQTMALTYDPQWGDFDIVDGEIHTFEMDVSDIVNSADYAELNKGGEDGWLEGHMRFVIGKALQRLIEEKAFEEVKRAPTFRIGYTYPDLPEAIIVGLVTG